MFVNFNNMHCGKKKISGRSFFGGFHVFIRGVATADKNAFLYLRFGVNKGAIGFSMTSRNTLYAKSSLYCLVILPSLSTPKKSPVLSFKIRIFLLVCRKEF